MFISNKGYYENVFPPNKPFGHHDYIKKGVESNVNLAQCSMLRIIPKPRGFDLTWEMMNHWWIHDLELTSIKQGFKYT